jgi:hypothetical protein
LDDDTAYHAAVGQLIREHGILHSFPWTPFTWLTDHYADKELLFHLVFVPFAHLNWVTASRIVGTIFGTTLLLTLYLLLRAENVRFAALWAIIPLTSSVLFLFRFALVRPHLLSITLSLLFLWAAVRSRLVILALVSFIFPWAYVAFWQIPCLLLLAAGAASLLSGDRLTWKPAVAVLGGIVIGLLLHPNQGNLLSINLTEMVDLLFKHSWRKDVGFDAIGDLNPYPLAGWVQGLFFSVLMIIASLTFAIRNRRNGRATLAFALAASGFTILTIRSARFAEYFVPFSVAAIALASRSIPWRFLPHLVMVLSVSWMAWVQPHIFSDWSKRPNYMPPDIAAFLQRQIQPGTQVFNTDWHLAGWLMLTLPERRFIVALDPTFLYRKDPLLYRIWYHISHDAPAGSAETIRRRFGARYVLAFNTPYSKKLFYQLHYDPSVRTLLVSDTWMLFDLGDSSP